MRGRAVRFASPTSPTEPLQCVVGESVKDHWHVDARQEWDQVLRDSGLVRTVHVDASKNLSAIFTSSGVSFGFVFSPKENSTKYCGESVFHFSPFGALGPRDIDVLR